MWQNPHILVIDETTNYLDRDAEGGEYVDVKLDDNAGDDQVIDASGNVLEVKREKKMEGKELKKAIKDIEKKLKDHNKKSNLTDEEAWALGDRLAELKAALMG